MKHIAVDARIINSSTGRYIERLLHYLEQIDKTNKYSILVRAKDKEYYKPTNPNFNIVVADYKDYSLGEQIGLLRLLNKLKPDLVHFCMPQQPVLYRGKKVTSIHDLTLMKVYNSDKNWLVYHFKQFIGYFVFKWVIRTSKKIITISQYSKKELSAFSKYASNKTVVTLLAADTIKGELESYKIGFEQFILYVGQQSDYKNIKRLGDAHQLLLDKYSNLGLVLVGRKNASALKNEAYFKSKDYKNILFTDFIPDSQKDWLYKNASAYIFPSLMEGFGLPGLEAMAYGTPVISSNATCLPEIYGDGAIYFDPLSVEDMAHKISLVLEDQILRKSLIHKGYDCLRKYSWKKTARQTHAVYMSVLKD